MELRLLYGLCFTSLLAACSHQPSPPKAVLKSYIVTMSTINKTLHFSGTIQPIRKNVLTTPMDGVVETMHYQYGQTVKKGDIVFTLHSAELQHQYNEILTEYLKTKDDFGIARAKFSGIEELWKSGIISKNNYLSEKSSLSTARISAIQSSQKLSELFEKTAETKYDDLSNLSFSEFSKVHLALTSKYNLIHIKAPSEGVLLYPPLSGVDSPARVSEGMSIKSDQVLALVGDLSGVSVEINVPEVEISAIKPGMLARIHGIAFGKHILKGHLIAVNSQATPGTNGGLPSFTAIIEVHALSKAQRNLIKVGMSAEIELSMSSTHTLLIPTASIKTQHGQRMVTVLAANGTTATRAIVTGLVEGDNVAIDSGLNAGEVVVYE